MRAPQLSFIAFVLVSGSALGSVELGPLSKRGAQNWYPQVAPGNVEVIGHGIATVKSKSGRSYTRSKLSSNLPSMLGLMSAQDALRALNDSTRLGLPVQTASDLARGLTLSKPKLVVAEVPMAGLRPLWRMRGPVRVEPTLSQKQYDVDAQTGEVVAVRELIQQVVSASVYPANPVSTPALTLLPLALQPSAPEAMASPELIAHNCVDNSTLRNVFGQEFRVCELSQSAVLNVDGNYTPTPDDSSSSTTRMNDAFSQVSMYAHTARAYAYFRALRAEPNAQVTVATQLNVVANVRFDPRVSSLFNGGSGDGSPSTAATPLRTLDNAFFYPNDGNGFISQIMGVTGGGLFFGQGRTIDYAYDGDVVYHEFGHAVVDHSLQLGGAYVEPWGYSFQPGAMNEGLADYFSSAITGEPNLGEYAGGWDSSGGIRNLANTFTCNENIAGEVHYDSQLFSGGLWSVRTALGSDAERATYDAAIYTAMRLHPGSESIGFHQFADMVRDVLQTELPAAEPIFLAEMTRRGILPGCAPTAQARSGVEVEAPEAFGSFSAYLAPGRQSSGLAITPGVTQFQTNVPASQAVGSTLEVSLGWYNPGGSGSNALKVVAHIDGPLVWSRKSGRYDNNGASYDLPGSRSGKVFIPLPEDAQNVYFQVVNVSDDSIYYGSVTSTLRAPGDLKPDAGLRDASVDAGRPSTNPGADAGLVPPTQDNASNLVGGGFNGGGGCNTTGDSATNAGLYALLMLGLARIAQRRSRV